MIGPISSLSVVVPAYNESSRLGRSLEAIRHYLAPRLPGFELIVVDDGSVDDTASIARAGGATTVLVNETNRGKGHSVRRGMLAATSAFVLFTDADLSTPIEELETLAARAWESDVVIGSRGLPGSRILQRQPLYRELMGRGFNLLVQAAALPGLHDTQCGFKLFRGPAAREVFSRVTIEGFGFDVEALWLARRLGYAVAEVPVMWIDDPASRVHPVRDAQRMAADLARVRWRHRRLTPRAAGGRAGDEASPERGDR